MASFWRLSPDENPHKCRERAHCMVCCLTASHTKQNSSTKDPKKRRVLFHLPFEVIFGMLRRSSHDIRAATYKPLLRPPSQCPRPGKDSDVQDTNCFSHLNASLRNGQLYFILLNLKISALDCSCRKPAIFAAYCPQ